MSSNGSHVSSLGVGSDGVSILMASKPLTAINRRGSRTSLMVQGLGICLPMQVIWVQSLVQEDPTCRGATKPVCRNY